MGRGHGGAESRGAHFPSHVHSPVAAIRRGAPVGAR